MDTKIIPVTDFIRKFGKYADILSRVDKIILTREGRPFATVKAVPEEKNADLLSFSGMWKNTQLDNDNLWKRVLSRKNRRGAVTIS